MADETNSTPAAASADTASTPAASTGTPSTGGYTPRPAGERGPSDRPSGGFRPRPEGGARPPRPGGPGGGPGGRKFFRRKKVCKFTVEKIDHISYRDVRLLQQFISDRGKIIPRRLTGTSAPFQRKLTRAIKQARAIALLPFAARF
ncbi:MAG: 30S ribosomal protein S18 [Acidobacteriota bacterium]|nr:30S ribosomal protein S18 [Acidobacteriota bacterium]